MINKKDPIAMASISLVILLFLIIAILYLYRPSWICVVNHNTGKMFISWKLLFTYSLTFALVGAIFVLLFVSKYSIKYKSLTQNSGEFSFDAGVKGLPFVNLKNSGELK